jgi:hypothetical protein
VTTCRCGQDCEVRSTEDWVYHPNVVLVDVEVRHAPCMGDHYGTSVVLPEVEGLHWKIALLVATQDERLSPDEIMFLRTWLDWPEADFLLWMDAEAAAIDHWESTRSPMPMEAEKERLLRGAVLRHLGAAYIVPQDFVPGHQVRRHPIRLVHSHWGWVRARDQAHRFVPSTVPGYEHTCANVGCGGLEYDEEHLGGVGVDPPAAIGSIRG